MARLDIDDDRLTVTFTTAEHIFGVVRDQSIPLSAVESASEVQSWREVRGLRVGLGIPRVRLVGRWLGRGHRQLVALRRGQPAVRIALRGQHFDELLIETPDPTAVLARLRGRNAP